MSAEWRMPSKSFASVLDGLALRFMRLLLFWKSATVCLDSPQSLQLMPPVPELEAKVPESVDREGKRNRAFAIACASVSFRGAAMDVEQLLSLADEFLEYIEGDDGATIPRPDILKPGKLPKR